MAKGRYHEWLQPDNLILLKKWARDGCKDEEIADRMHINISTLYKWKQNYGEIDEALKKNKSIVDAEFEESTLKASQEHEVVERTIVRQRDKETGEMVVIKETENRKIMPANALLSIFIMKNRMPEQYKDKQDLAVSGQAPVVISGDKELQD